MRPDMWLRLMLGGPLHELGVEYTEPVAQLALRISSRGWMGRRLRLLCARAGPCLTGKR